MQVFLKYFQNSRNILLNFHLYNNMNNLKYAQVILALIINVLLLTNCKDFLDIRQEASVPSIGMDYGKAENIFLPVSNAYASMRSNSNHGFAYIGAFEITSDNADKGSTPEDSPMMIELDNFSYEPSNTLINELWLGYFNIVSAANNALFQMPLFEEALQSEENKKYTRECAAEAKVIRAYAYFNLTRLFGRVPIIKNLVTADELTSFSQAETNDLYEFILKDLEEAIPLLPDSYTKEWAGRINKYTAMAIKAKVHLYRSEWDSVADLSDRIMASGRYVLLSSFREVFSIDGKNSKESLFEIQSSTLGKSSGEATYIEYAFYQGPRGNTPGNMQGWGFCTPSDDLIQFFDDRGETVRAATTFLYRGTTTPEGDYIRETCANPVYNGKVYTPSKYNNWSYNGYGFDQNVRILRYSDVLLMFAEAKLNGATLGNTSGQTALSAVNEVRDRVRLSLLTDVTMQDVWDERRAELALEEDRFFDLIRTGQAAEALGAKGFREDKHTVFPIPTTQMQLNRNLEQNPGYTN